MSKASQQSSEASEQEWYFAKVLELQAAGDLPYSDEAKLVFANTLRRECDGREHAQRAIRAALEAGAPLFSNGKPEWNLAELRNFIGSTRKREQRAANPDCSKCGGFGWKQVFALHTETRDCGKVREWITKAQHDDLLGKIDRKTQSLHEGVRSCPNGCTPRGHFHPENVR